MGKVHYSGPIIDTGKYSILTAAKTLTVDDWGKVFFLSATTEFTVTMPPIADVGIGFYVKFIIKTAPSGADYVITENTGSDTDKIQTNGIIELEVDTGTDGLANATHTTITFADGVAIAGDWVQLECDGTLWYAHGQANADGGISLA